MLLCAAVAGAAAVGAPPPTAPPRLLLATDLDHTLVQNEDASHARLLALNALWSTRLACDGGDDGGPSLLVYSTGRSPALFAALWVRDRARINVRQQLCGARASRVQENGR